MNPKTTWQPIDKAPREHELECLLEKALKDQRVLMDARCADFQRIMELERAIATFLSEWAPERQPHGGIDDDPPSSDTIAFHARRILGRALRLKDSS